MKAIFILLCLAVLNACSAAKPVKEIDSKGYWGHIVVPEGFYLEIENLLNGAGLDYVRGTTIDSDNHEYISIGQMDIAIDKENMLKAGHEMLNICGDLTVFKKTYSKLDVYVFKPEDYYSVIAGGLTEAELDWFLGQWCPDNMISNKVE
jgi:hypothetical protein